jgi:hypothetical protein
MCGVALVQDRCDPSKQMPVTVNRKELRLHCAIKRLATVALGQQHAQPAERYDEKMISRLRTIRQSLLQILLGQRPRHQIIALHER